MLVYICNKDGRLEYWELCQSISLKLQSQSMDILVIVTFMV